MPAILKRPPQRCQKTMRLEPDLIAAIDRLAHKQRMKKADVICQIVRAGLEAIGEFTKPAA